MEDSSILLLALDYDMEFWEVEDIVKKYPNNYHDALEAFIKERANK